MPLADTEVQLLMSALENLRQDMSGIRSDISSIASKMDSLASDSNGRLSVLEEKVRVNDVAHTDLARQIQELKRRVDNAEATGPNTAAWWVRVGGVAKQIVIWLAIAGAVAHYIIPPGFAKAILGATQLAP